jgi:hypothetical protein
LEVNPLEEQIRQLFGRMIYTHKTHEKERERLSMLATRSKWLNIALGALTLGGVASALGTSSFISLIASTILATATVGYAFVQLSFDPLRDANQHRAAAKQLLAIRDNYESLLIDMMSGAVTDDEARTRRDELAALSQDAYRLAPDTSPRVYATAQESLQQSEDMTFSSEEIDAFLPEALRRAEIKRAPSADLPQ